MRLHSVAVGVRGIESAATERCEGGKGAKRWQGCQSGTGGNGAKVAMVRRQTRRRLGHQLRQKMARWRRPPSNSFRAAATGGTEDLRQACTGMVGESGGSAGMLEVIESDFAPLGISNKGARSHGSERAQLRQLKSAGFTPRQKIEPAAAERCGFFP